MVLNSMEASVEPGHLLMSESSSKAVDKRSGVESWEPFVSAAVAATPELTEMIQQFWGLPVQVVFLGVGSQTHYFWRQDDFHVSQLMLEAASEPNVAGQSASTVSLRLSDAACSSLLSLVLGPCSNFFSFKQLSPLEATVLNEFSRDLLAGFKKNLIRKPGKSRRQPQPIHLIWVLQPESASAEAEEIGKIILTLPANAIRLPKMETTTADDQDSEDIIPDDFFFHVQGDARIYLGNTRVALSDLDHLEPEDIIILENSHADQMYVVEPTSGEKVPFSAEIRQKQKLTIPYTQELAMMDTEQQSTSAKQTLWDNLMIEVGAEFEPIKLPLKQLKQMTEGLVIEVGDLVHNRICLQVEGKTLAWGELIIVGDKFGVRICQVEGNQQQAGQSEARAMIASSEQPQQAAVQPQTAASADGEENLDNFLNEDFDDTFDDEEEDW